MFEELSSNDKRYVMEYVRDLFGDGVVSFTRVATDYFVDILVIRSVERGGVRRWDNIYVEVTPERAATVVHYVDGLYRVWAVDENEFRRLINSWWRPAYGRFLGGVEVPRGVKEFCYRYSYIDGLLFADERFIGVVNFTGKRGWVVPEKLRVALHPPSIGGFLDVNLGKIIRGEHRDLPVPVSMLVKNAPEEYYDAAVEVLLSPRLLRQRGHA